MRVLVIGGGGREHALAWRLSQSNSVRKVYCAPGNGGTWTCAENVPAKPEDAVRLSRELHIDLVVVGPEGPLIQGLADRLRAEGIAVFGPGAGAARLEGSKAFAKALMAKAGIPTAEFQSFDDPAAAREYVSQAYARGTKLVVKASGEAFGKGAIVTDTEAEALQAVEDMMVRRVLGDAGATVVIEERMEGPEMSLFSLRSANQGFLTPAVRDYKRALDGGRGPNTGGMGARTLHGVYEPGTLEDLHEVFCDRAAEALKAEGHPFVGLLYAGLMLTAHGARCLEYNCRFGDPETQVLVRIGDDDWGEMLYGLATGKPISPPTWEPMRHVVAITVASKGYPGEIRKGLPISGLEHAALLDEVMVFHAGTVREDGKLLTNGGRVLSVTAAGDTLEQARHRAYEAVELIRFEDMHYRRDIAV